MPLPCLLLSIHHIFFEKYRLTNAHFPAIILELPKTAGAARRKSCRGALNKIFSACLSVFWQEDTFYFRR